MKTAFRRFNLSLIILAGNQIYKSAWGNHYCITPTICGGSLNVTDFRLFQTNHPSIYQAVKYCDYHFTLTIHFSQLQSPRRQRKSCFVFMFKLYD